MKRHHYEQIDFKYYSKVACTRIKQNMRSHCFTKHVATELELPRVLTLFAPKLKFSTAFKNVNCKKVCYVYLSSAQMPKRKFCNGCNTDTYQPYC